ncbi:MAG TPA: hypothetical protein VNU26_16465 [Mycobacteriales bacterium]|nr:hypothetical protein [Mycobacteriales bacterium]
MSDPGAAAARRRSRAVRVLAGWLALQLAVGLVAAVRLAPDGERAPSTPSGASGQVRGAPADPVVDPRVAREQAVRRLLDARAAAVLARDREAFLAGVWTGAPEFVQRQSALFDNLAGVPLDSWSYQLDPLSERAADPALDAKYGAGRWWAPDVVLSYALAEFDPEPTYAPQGLTFVQVGETWQLAADDDFAVHGHPTARALWDGGPVVQHRGTSSLVLGHPGSEQLLRQVGDVVDRAVPRVTAVWGPEWSQQVVVLVPSDQAELDTMLGGTTDLTSIAAVATAELTGVGEDYNPVGNRVIVNPPNFAKLGRLGRQVVLTHETTHVATRAATGPDVPTWLVEGFADYVGYLDVDVPLGTSARETRDAVRGGWRPAALPADNDFNGSNPRLAQAYETSWLAFRLLVDTYGLPRALAFYRAVGASRTDGAELAVEKAFAAELGTSTAAFTALWQQHLVSTFS